MYVLTDLPKQTFPYTNFDTQQKSECLIDEYYNA